MKTNVHIIKAFEGPRHDRLERIWQTLAALYSDQARVIVHENPGATRNHARMLAEMWEDEQRRPETQAIITEMDFLPAPGWLNMDEPDPILASEYCTRNSYTRELIRHGCPGAWFLLFKKENLDRLDFSAGGPGNDPAAKLPARLLATKDCYPRHFGVEVVGRGEHLFFSRHYNDPPTMVVGGMILGAIQQRVDKTIEDYECLLKNHRLGS